MLNTTDENTLIPHEVIKMTAIDDLSLVTAWRKHLGFSQSKLAKAIGITQLAMSKLENPATKPNAKTRQRIADALGIHVNQLTND